MTKIWMIILITTAHVHNSSMDFYHQNFNTGSIYSSEKDCMNAIIETVKDGNEAFCVETYFKPMVLK